MPTEDPPRLFAISASFPLAAFLDVRAEALSYGTDVRLAGQVRRRSGNWHALDYVSDGPFDALFAPRG